MSQFRSAQLVVAAATIHTVEGHGWWGLPMTHYTDKVGEAPYKPETLAAMDIVGQNLISNIILISMDFSKRLIPVFNAN